MPRFFLLAFSFVLIACSPAAPTPQAPEPVATEPIDTPTTATVKGTVKLKGEAPPVRDLKDLMARRPDMGYCSKGDTRDQTWMIADGRVENVVVWLERAEGKPFKVAAELRQRFKDTTVVIDAPFCYFAPRTVALYADIQPLRFECSSPMNHIVHSTPDRKVGAPRSEYLAAKSKGEARTFKMQQAPIRVDTTAFEFMRANILIFDHPYFAVTKKDGTCEIPNVPIDVELTVFLWHEARGKLEAQKVKFKEGENVLDLSITAK